MQNYEEKFFDYLKGRMHPDANKKFEDELNNSASLQVAFNEYKKIMEIINETKNVTLKPGFNQSVVYKFRTKLDEKKSSKTKPVYKITFASLIILLLGYFIVSQTISLKTNTNNNALTDLSLDEIKMLAEDNQVITGSESDLNDKNITKIDSIYKQSISKTISENSDNNSNVFFTDYDLTDLENRLSENEVEKIYTQLIEKQIL